MFSFRSQLAYLVRYYLASLLGRRRPLLGGMKLTHACNLKCRHCPFWKRKGASLSFAAALDAMQALHDRGVRLLIFEGGEPFLWQDGRYRLADLVVRARELFFSVGVTTNGTFPIDSNADIVWVSIDGLKATHDRIRGESFDRIMANVAASSHPRLYAHVTINSLNAGEIPALVRFLAGKVAGVTVQFHYPYEELDESLLLPPPRRAAVLDELIALKKAGLPLADSYACLRALKDNRWRCQPWMIASVDPDGTLTHGCYLKGRGAISCERCGFSAHTEISLAYAGAVGAIFTGCKVFGSRREEK
ncbi:MAG: radical SAM protein [Kiritimatiellae bacterium]|nr:radical SAM protein [Kiritimatiellia bacterium]